MVCDRKLPATSSAHYLQAKRKKNKLISLTIKQNNMNTIIRTPGKDEQQCERERERKDPTLAFRTPVS